MAGKRILKMSVVLTVIACGVLYGQRALVSAAPAGEAAAGLGTVFQEDNKTRILLHRESDTHYARDKDGTIVGEIRASVSVNYWGDVKARMDTLSRHRLREIESKCSITIFDRRFWKEKLDDDIEGLGLSSTFEVDVDKLDQDELKQLQECVESQKPCVTFSIEDDVRVLRAPRRPRDRPGPIKARDNTSLIVILPGIAGENRRLRKIKKMLEHYPTGDGLPHVEIWDWTELEYVGGLFPIRDRLEIWEELINSGKELAGHLVKWKEEQTRNNRDPRVYLVGLSGGATIAALTCEQMLAEETFRGKFFEKVVFLSGALDLRHPSLIRDVNRCSKGIYNYLSYHDTTLTESKFIALFFGIPFNINAHVKWPAVGRFGWSPEDVHNYEYITSQLCWIDDRYEGGIGEHLGNRGKHLRPGCLAPKYFERFLQPLFHKEASMLPGRDPVTHEGWDKELHPAYLQDRRLRRSEPEQVGS